MSTHLTNWKLQARVFVKYSNTTAALIVPSVANYRDPLHPPQPFARHSPQSTVDVCTSESGRILFVQRSSNYDQCRPKDMKALFLIYVLVSLGQFLSVWVIFHG